MEEHLGPCPGKRKEKAGHDNQDGSLTENLKEHRCRKEAAAGRGLGRPPAHLLPRRETLEARRGNVLEQTACH